MVAALASGGVVAEVVASEGRVGGGSAPGVVLAGWAVSLPSSVADALRAGDPAVLARVHEGRALLDPRALAEEDDDVVVSAVLAAVVGPRGR
jgi:L-seryl-tRNA(Ser) seleniumtransferase